MLQTKAISLAEQFGYSTDDFKCLSGWLSRFKDRHGIVFRQVCGEAAAIRKDSMDPWLTQTLPEILTKYRPCDIYNADETGLYWRLLPDRTLAKKGETCPGGKKSKERVTILVAGNMDGSDKLPLLVIGKCTKPQCFKNARHLPVKYTSQKKALMTSSQFTN